jgi:hypothetical protein
MEPALPARPDASGEAGRAHGPLPAALEPARLRRRLRARRLRRLADDPAAPRHRHRVRERLALQVLREPRPAHAQHDHLPRGRRRLLGRAELPRRDRDPRRAQSRRHPRRLHERPQPGRQPGEPLRGARPPLDAGQDAGVEHGVRALLHGRRVRGGHRAGLRGSRRRPAAPRLASQRGAQHARRRGLAA